MLTDVRYLVLKGYCPGAQRVLANEGTETDSGTLTAWRVFIVALRCAEARTSGLDRTLRFGFDELEAIAKSSSMPHHGANGDRPGRQLELQFNQFAYGKLQSQHGRDSRLADIHRVSRQQTRAARIDTDIGVQREAWMAAQLDRTGRMFRSGLVVGIQLLAPSGRIVHNK